MKNYEWIGWTLFGCTLLIMFFGVFWIAFASDAEFTVQFAMDERTMNVLLENNYCIYHNTEPSTSNKPDITFMGECEYLYKVGLLNITGEYHG